MEKQILRAEHIQKYYGGKGNVTKAIDDISFEVRKGEFVGIMGASGSGKTTLLNCISTIDTVTAGKIWIAGEDITALKRGKLSDFRREKLGFIFQQFNLLDTLTAYENIALALSILKVPVKEIEKRVAETAKLLDIREVLGKYPYEMSGGQQQRVAAARAIIPRPELILADGEIYEVMKPLNEVGSFAGVHCGNASVIDVRIREFKAASRLGPDAHPQVRPDILEAEAVHRLMTIAEATDAPVMVVHLTNKKALDEVEAARKRGQTVLAETCPQYLLLDERVFYLPDFESAKYICSSPIRSKENQDVLWKALAERRINTIAPDHCSFTMAQKEMGKEDFTKIPNGMPGLETREELIYSEGVEKGRLTLEQACTALSENPARLYGIYPQKGVLVPGNAADITVIDPSGKDRYLYPPWKATNIGKLYKLIYE